MSFSPAKTNNSDIENILTIDNFRDQHSPVKLNAPTYYPMKNENDEESFSDVVGFPTPK